jgi:hypothetical protein
MSNEATVGEYTCPMVRAYSSAFAFYSRWQSPEWQFHSFQLLMLEGDTVARLTSFVTATFASVFDLPDILPDTAGAR